MQHTVFSVEPQSGGATNLPGALDTKTLSATRPAEHFSAVFVEPDTSDPEARASDAHDAPALTSPPNAATSPPDLDGAVLGLKSEMALDRGVSARQGPEVAASPHALAKTARHSPVANGDAIDALPFRAMVARDSNTAQTPSTAGNAVPVVHAARVSATAARDAQIWPAADGAIPTNAQKLDDLLRPGSSFEGRQAVADSKSPNFRQDTQTRWEGSKIARDAQNAQDEYAQKSALGVQDQGVREASSSSHEAPKSHPDRWSIPGIENRTPAENATTVKPDRRQNAQLRTDSARLRQTSSTQTQALGQSFRHPPREAAPAHTVPPMSNAPVRSPSFNQSAVVSNGAMPFHQFAASTENTRFPGTPAAELELTRTINPPTAKSDQPAVNSASLIQSAIPTGQSDYTVNISSRSVDRQPLISLEHAPRTLALPVELPATSDVRGSANSFDVPAIPKTAILVRATTPSAVGNSVSRRAAPMQSAQQLPTATIAAATPAALQLPPSASPIFLGLPEFFAMTPGLEGLESLEQTLIADGADRLSRQARASVLDVLQSSDGGIDRVKLARSVSAQLGDAARASVGGTIEVRLSPEELGRVRLSMTQSELGLTVTIVAERAETLDLIRRNTDIFAQDLRNLGHQNIAFSFDQGGEQRPFDHVSGDADTAAEDSAGDPESTQQVVPASRVAEDGRLDIRL